MMISFGVGVSPDNASVYHGSNLKVINGRMRVVEVVFRCILYMLDVLVVVLVGFDKQKPHKASYLLMRKQRSET